jgi:hypothetical protein
MGDEMISPITPKVNYGWIGESFSLFRNDPAVLVASVVLTMIVTSLVCYPLVGFAPYTSLYAVFHGHIQTGVPATPLTTRYAANFFPSIVAVFFYGGQFKMANKTVRGEKLQFGNIFSGWDSSLPFLAYSCIMFLSFIAGMCAVCVGAFFIYMLVWPAFALVADGVKPTKAFLLS